MRPSIPVSRAHSAATIWGAPWDNWRFRAWHDETHLTLRADFTLSGEARTAAQQRAELHAAGFTGEDVELVWADTFGQAWHFDRFGSFPNDQRGFDRAFVDGHYGDGVRVSGRYSGKEG